MTRNSIADRHSSRLSRAVFLDRDGVINRCEVRNGKPYSPRHLNNFRLLPGAAAAIGALKSAGLLVIVVTNQPDIGNGLVASEVVEAMHERMRRCLAIDDILMCPHRQDAGCECRKPRSGMLLQAAKKWCIDLSQSFMVGDRWSDVVAGQAVGCYTVFVDRGYKESRSVVSSESAKSLRSAARMILSLV
jgi:D-glycero-D-manno-heptose 1,7-bisphosphate phosphatase